MKNKKCILATVVFAALALSLLADSPLIEDKIVRQRWPWSGKVDIDYLYTGTTVTSMSFTATWRGQSTPTNLVGVKSEGAFRVAPGLNHFEWDPADLGLSSQTLLDFDVQIAPVASDSRTYLVVDLANGGYSFLSGVPAGGWTSEYKTSKMVFKRIPKGTYRWGTSEYGEYRAVWSGGQSGAIGRGSTLHDVTYTSDYYFPIFELTQCQNSWIVSGSAVTGDSAMRPCQPSSVMYTSIRGETLDDGTTTVCWPQTGHKVNSTSFIGKLRAIIERNGQPSLLADLPTTDQWQLAMSAGTSTFWPNGGTAAEKDVTGLYESYLAEICWTDAKSSGWNHDVGTKAANGWGFYDYFINWNPCLNWINAGSTVDNDNPAYWDLGDRTDYYGPEYPTEFTGAQAGKTFRVMCSYIARDIDSTTVRNSGGYKYTMFMRAKVQENVASAFVVPRVAINLKPLVEVD